MSRLRDLFGPSKKEVWQSLSAQIDGRYFDPGFWHGDRVEAEHGEWVITLDTYTVSTGKVTTVFTRIRAPYVNPEGFRFTIYREGVFSDIAKWLGMQDVEIGLPNFDNAFVIKGTDETRLRRLFANDRIRQLVESQPDILLTVKDDEGCFRQKFPDGVDELYFAVHGVIKDVERLERLYELFAATLDQLCELGAAYRHPPGIKI
jgi:hypothetical protein